MKKEIALGLIKIALLAITVLVVWHSAMSVDQTPVERPVVEDSSSAVLSNTVCEDVAPGTFPTGAIVQKIGGSTYFTANPTKVSKAFDMALGKEWHGVGSVTLCK